MLSLLSSCSSTLSPLFLPLHTLSVRVALAASHRDGNKCIERWRCGIGGGGAIKMEQLMGSTATEAPVQPCGQQQTGKLISICTTAKWPSGYCCCCCCLPPFSGSFSLSFLPLASLLPQRVVHFANEQQALPCCHRYRLLPSACRATLLPCCLLPPPYELILCRCTVG